MASTLTTPDTAPLPDDLRRTCYDPATILGSWAALKNAEIHGPTHREHHAVWPASAGYARAGDKYALLQIHDAAEALDMESAIDGHRAARYLTHLINTMPEAMQADVERLTDDCDTSIDDDECGHARLAHVDMWRVTVKYVGRGASMESVLVDLGRIAGILDNDGKRAAKRDRRRLKEYVRMLTEEENAANDDIIELIDFQPSVKPLRLARRSDVGDLGDYDIEPSVSDPITGDSDTEENAKVKRDGMVAEATEIARRRLEESRQSDRDVSEAIDKIIAGRKRLNEAAGMELPSAAEVLGIGKKKRGVKKARK